MSWTGARGPSRRTAGECPAITGSGGKIRQGLPQDLVGLPRRAVLALRGLRLLGLGHPGRDTGAIAAIGPGPS